MDKVTASRFHRKQCLRHRLHDTTYIKTGSPPEGIGIGDMTINVLTSIDESLLCAQCLPHLLKVRADSLHLHNPCYTWNSSKISANNQETILAQCWHNVANGCPPRSACTYITYLCSTDIHFHHAYCSKRLWYIMQHLHHFVDFLTSSKVNVWLPEMKINTSVTPAPGNVHANFGFLCLFKLKASMRQGVWNARARPILWPVNNKQNATIKVTKC